VLDYVRRQHKHPPRFVDRHLERGSVAGSVACFAAQLVHDARSRPRRGVLSANTFAATHAKITAMQPSAK
jgi:hypothetical protein